MLFFTALMGGSRLVGHWARLPRFGGWCAVVGRPLCPVGGLQARVAGKNSKKRNPFFLLSSFASLPISVFVPLVGRVFHFSPWPLIYAIEPLIDQKTSNFFN